MKTRIRPWALVLALSIFAGLLLAACSGAEKSREESDALARVSGIATRVKTLESKDKGTSGDVAAMKQSLASIQADLETVKGQVAELQGSTALQKKIDDLSAKVTSLTTKLDGVSSKVTSLEQKISLLETRFNEHIRRCYTYHAPETKYC